MNNRKVLVRFVAAGLLMIMVAGFFVVKVGASSPAFSAIRDRSTAHEVYAGYSIFEQLDDEGPVAVDDTDTTDEDKAKDINVTSNDILANNAISLSIVSPPSNGEAVPKNKNEITYTPNLNYYGTDQFTYRVCSNGNGDDDDDDGGCDEADVIVTVRPVNDPPTAVNDSATTLVNTSVTIAVMNNDSDIDGDSVFLQKFDSKSQQGGSVERDVNGTPFILSDDRLIYTPPVSFFGMDSFTYTISDGQLESEPAVVTIEVSQGDAQEPTVSWVAPVSDQEVYHVNDEIIVLEVQASDNEEIDKVIFTRWDAVLEKHVELGEVTSPPYQLELDTSTLNLGWNQVNVRAYDTSGNPSSVAYIWLYKTMQIYLPVASR